MIILHTSKTKQECIKLIKKKRYLITTEDEATWKFDHPVIFLGEWCRLYNRKHIWQNMDAIVAKPYGLGVAKKDTDDLKAKALEQKLFPELYKLLNHYFGTSHSERFWKIILGPYFKRILTLLLNRINTLKQCLETEEIAGITLYSSEYCSLVPPNLKFAYNHLFDDEKWNNVLNGRILNLLDNKKIPINFLEEKYNRYSYQDNVPLDLGKNLSIKSKFKNYIYYCYKKLSKTFVRNEDAFLISTYLPTKEIFKIELALRQWPQIWKRIELSIDLEPNKSLRKNLTEKFIKKSKDDVENIVRILLFELLPVCNLEGFNELKKVVHQKPWPKSPKFIFTSNDFNTDEIFKLYTAIKTENGTKYYCGQHGNNYFTSRYHSSKTEEQTADKFFTWGWKSSPKHVPTFIFKTVGVSNIHNTKGGLLLIEKPQNTRIATWDSYKEFHNFFEDQKKFVSALEHEPKKNLTIRLSANKGNLKFNENSRWFDFNKSLKINSGRIPIQNLITESRLVVHAYDSTGMLETLSQNIPTLAFWQNNFDHLREKVVPEYQMLVDAGIVHLSAESVADKVNEIWSDIDKWWLQKNVQEAKNFFCNIYARNSEDPVKTMASLLIKKDI